MPAPVFPLLTPQGARISSIQSSDDRTIRINVAGRVFETLESTLSRYPHTLLGNHHRRREFYRSDRGEYYLDRHSASFEYILYYYQSQGHLYHPPDVPFLLFYGELEFYGIDRDDVRKLCDQIGYPRSKSEVYAPAHRFLYFLWSLIDNPNSSGWAMVYTVVSSCIVLLSITTTCLETFPEWETYVIVTQNYTTADNWLIRSSNFMYHDQFYILECFTCVWFSVELLLRFYASPLKRYFFFDVLNLIDVIAVVPQIVAIILDPITSSEDNSQNKNDPSNFASIRALRILRIFRILTLGRHSQGLRIMGLTLKASIQELLLLVMIVLVGMLLFSSFIYFLESDVNRPMFRSIPATFWFVVVTITTVGYGDMYPTSVGGKIVAGICAICGSLSVALAIPVIVNNFLTVYSFMKQGEMVENKKVHYVKFRRSCMSKIKRKTRYADPDEAGPDNLNHIS